MPKDNKEVVVIYEDNHNERAGYYRAYWASSPKDTIMCPVFGYADSIPGSYKTIKAVKAEVQKYYPNEPVYRNGKLVK